MIVPYRQLFTTISLNNIQNTNHQQYFNEIQQTRSFLTIGMSVPSSTTASVVHLVLIENDVSV